MVIESQLEMHADMDVPMFEKTHHRFAVGNASEKAKQVLEGKFEQGVQEIYNRINSIRHSFLLHFIYFSKMFLVYLLLFLSQKRFKL